MDDLHRELFAKVTGGSWEHGTEAAVDMTLLGRYYERFADHAVSVGHRVIWLVTGELRPGQRAQPRGRRGRRDRAALTLNSPVRAAPAGVRLVR